MSAFIDRNLLSRSAKGFAAVLMLTAGGALLSGCGSLGGSLGSSDGSITDRFTQLFGSRSQEVGTSPAQQQQANEPDCPGVDIRSGAATLMVRAGGRGADAGDLRYQGTISRTARECALAGNNIQAKIGIQGRILVGPAGAPASVDIPLRIAVVQEGTQPKTVFTKFYRASVAVPPGEGNVPFTFVAEDIVYPTPAPNMAEAYVFYIGFDPDGAKTAPRAKPSRKR